MSNSHDNVELVRRFLEGARVDAGAVWDIFAEAVEWDLAGIPAEALAAAGLAGQGSESDMSEHGHSR